MQLPKGWTTSVRNAVLNVVGIVRIAMHEAASRYSRHSRRRDYPGDRLSRGPSSSAHHASSPGGVNRVVIRYVGLRVCAKVRFHAFLDSILKDKIALRPTSIPWRPRLGPPDFMYKYSRQKSVVRYTADTLQANISGNSAPIEPDRPGCDADRKPRKARGLRGGGHGARTRNPLRGTSFPMRPLAIRLPSGRLATVGSCQFSYRNGTERKSSTNSSGSVSLRMVSFGLRLGTANLRASVTAANGNTSSLAPLLPQTVSTVPGRHADREYCGRTSYLIEQCATAAQLSQVL